MVLPVSYLTTGGDIWVVRRMGWGGMLLLLFKGFFFMLAGVFSPSETYLLNNAHHYYYGTKPVFLCVAERSVELFLPLRFWLPKAS